MSMLDLIIQRRDECATRAAQIVDTAQTEQRGLSTVERAEHDGLVADVTALGARIEEVREEEASRERAARTRVETGEHLVEQRTGPVGSGWQVGAEARTYHAGPGSPSYFRDLATAVRGDHHAIERLARNNAEVGLTETRALGNTGATGGAGGEFAPPDWITQAWVKLARPGRVTADLFHHAELPSGVSSVNLPRVLTGTAVAAQTTQNTQVANVDMTTAALSSGIVTIAGSQTISQQLLDQSAVPFDEIVMQDLTAEYARQLGTMVLTGAGTSGTLRGYLTAATTNNVTWTSASPTASAFYSKLAQLQGQINATRYMPADTIVCHPRRWAWFASFTDSTGRPMIVPAAAGAMNSMAVPGAQSGAAGFQGTVLGMDCYTDPNIPTTLGTGSSQDVVLMFPRDDIWLWESSLRAEAWTGPYANTISVVYRVFNYAAMIPDRYPASLGQITGTGLVAPTFTS